MSASLGLSSVLSPNLFPIWLCLSPWVGCCVRLAGLVSQFVFHLALSFTLAGVLCPPRWACLPICLLSCLSPWLGCCVRFAGLVCGLVSQFVSHLALAPSFLSPFVSHLALSLGCCVLLLPTDLPTDLPTYLQRAELQVSRAVGRRPVPSLLLHHAVIKPPIHPPTLTLPTHHLIHPASVPVACHQCGQPRSPKCSEATSGLRSFVGFGLVKITVLSHGQESFPGLVWAWPNVLQRQSLSTVRRSAPWTELSVAKPGVKLRQANVRCFGGPSSLP